MSRFTRSKNTLRSENNLEDMGSLDTNDELETVRTRILEQQQEISNLKTLIAQLLQKETTKSNDSVPETLQDSSALSSIPPSSSGRVEELMLRTAQLAIDSTPVEQKAPNLTSASQNAWWLYLEKHKIYKKKGGKKSHYKSFDESTINAYEELLKVKDLETLTDAELEDKIKDLHSIVSSAMSLLKLNVKMPYSKKYEKEKIENFMQLFLFTLKKYPMIKEDLEEEVIIDHFFSQIQPTSIGIALQAFKIKSISVAIEKLKKKLLRKDIQLDEETEALGIERSKYGNSKPGTSDSLSRNDGTDEGTPLLDRNGTEILCLNCIHSKKPRNTNHFIWNCTNKSWCYQCAAKHFPMGHECPKADVKKFNYDVYLSKQQEKESVRKNNSTTLVITNKQKKKVTTVDDDTSLPRGYATQKTNPQREMFIKNALKYYDNQQCQMDGYCPKLPADESSEIGDFKFDSAANETFINKMNLSDSIIRLTPTEKAKDQVQIAAGAPLDIAGVGDILNHTAHYVPNFHDSLLSVQQTLQSNDSLALFTDHDVHVVRNYLIITV